MAKLFYGWTLGIGQVGILYLDLELNRYYMIALAHQSWENILKAYVLYKKEINRWKILL